MAHRPYERVEDALEYRAPEISFSFASDMFSVGVLLCEMATGELPSDELVNTIEDPAKRELVAFALREQRPTAEELAQKIALLAPDGTMESQFRAQVFASMRFNDNGPLADRGEAAPKQARVAGRPPAHHFGGARAEHRPRGV